MGTRCLSNAIVLADFTTPEACLVFCIDALGLDMLSAFDDYLGDCGCYGPLCTMIGNTPDNLAVNGAFIGPDFMGSCP